MSYCTQSDLSARFGDTELIQLTDRTNSGAINTTVLNQALADADAEIDSYLVARYSLPLDSIPQNLTRLACDITRYRLYENAATDTVQKRYDQAIRYLVQIGNGTLALSQITTPASGGTLIESDTAIYSNSPVYTSGQVW